MVLSSQLTMKKSSGQVSVSGMSSMTVMICEQNAPSPQLLKAM
jgi:hypothetical protein